jgi:hydrogenase maturation factor
MNLPLGWERATWLAVHILASDAVTSGLPPLYITIDLNLPMSMTRDEFETMWRICHRECEKIGMAIISGHTGRYPGCEYAMIGGATVICIGPKDKYVTPAMARVGDRIVITKGAAVEAAGLFAVVFRERVEETYGKLLADQAEEFFYQMSVVDDALTAVKVGVRDDGVTSMHDATECGIWGGLYEVAQASGVGMAIDKDKIIVHDIARKICDLFGMELFSAISEGSLIITCRPHKTAELLQILNDRGIPATEVGEVVEPEKGIMYYSESIAHELVHPRVDPFWEAFGKAATFRR